MSLDFLKPHRDLHRVRSLDLRRCRKFFCAEMMSSLILFCRVVVTTFGKRRKMLRASLRSECQ